jgi:Sec-independent protein secretion pathway component TatC
MADAYAVALEPHSPSMPLLAHLEELRKRVILSVVGVLVGFCPAGRWLTVSSD